MKGQVISVYEVMTGYFILCQINSGYDNLCQVRSGYYMYQVKSVYDIGQDRPC